MTAGGWWHHDGMLKAMLGTMTLCFAALTHGAQPVIDNERATVWDTPGPLPASLHDFVSVRLDRKGTAAFGHQGEIPGKVGSRTIVIELKGSPVAPIANESGYPPAFPRSHARKLFENTQVAVWDYTWRPGMATPMHFHDKDALVVYEETGALKSMTPDGKSVVTGFKFGEVRFSPRSRLHSEILASDRARAVIAELK